MTNVLKFAPPSATSETSDAKLSQRVVMRPSENVWLEELPPTPSQDVHELHRHRPSFSVALITTFSPEPYDIKKPLPISIYESDDEYTASFFDANIHTTGDNEQEAFDNVKSLILDMFDGLVSRMADELGPGPRRQLAVLDQFISKG
jgi:hypothetical protein